MRLLGLGLPCPAGRHPGQLPQAVDLSARRLLDIGGGTGSWSMALVQHYPNLSATVLELPVVADLARRRIADADVTGVSVIAGDALTGDLPTGYDTFLLADLIHYYSPDQNRALLRRLRAIARLLLADFWTTTSTPNQSTPPSWPENSPFTSAPAMSTAPAKSPPG